MSDAGLRQCVGIVAATAGGLIVGLLLDVLVFASDE